MISRLIQGEQSNLRFFLAVKEFLFYFIIRRGIYGTVFFASIYIDQISAFPSAVTSFSYVFSSSCQNKKLLSMAPDHDSDP